MKFFLLIVSLALVSSRTCFEKDGFNRFRADYSEVKMKPIHGIEYCVDIKVNDKYKKYLPERGLRWNEYYVRTITDNSYLFDRGRYNCYLATYRDSCLMDWELFNLRNKDSLRVASLEFVGDSCFAYCRFKEFNDSDSLFHITAVSNIHISTYLVDDYGYINYIGDTSVDWYSDYYFGIDGHKPTK